jgi:pyruvate dehydrogenase (quinone)
MARTASDVLIQTTLEAWDVDVVFGLPGDGINGIMGALRKRQVRHEESAAFMACGYAKHTGKLGCCLATSGLDGQPVPAITGMQFHGLTQTHSQQDVELDKLFAGFTVEDPKDCGAALQRECWRPSSIQMDPP